MTCPNCTHARTKAHWPGFTASCRGCQVRALACGPAFFHATQAAQITPAYRAALQTLLGDDWQAGHAEVKAEHARLKALAFKPNQYSPARPAEESKRS